ncbi:MAG TPA: hypothetical protein VGE02_05825 [Gemmatimonadales bacterium]
MLVPDGVGVRNFVLGPMLQCASRRGPVAMVHAIPEQVLPRYLESAPGEVEWRPLRPHGETALAFVLRNALSYAHMHHVDSLAMRYTRRRPVRGSWRTRTAFGAARVIGRTAASERGIRLLDGWHYAVVGRMPQVAEYRREFERMRPSVLFCSHQRPATVLAPVLAARSLGIPTATFIFSWDNLTSKGRIAAPFDHFLVWSDLMRDELLRFYPEVTPDRVHVVGTPQFDPYADPALHATREQFFERIGADPRRPLVCYSGGDIECNPEDQDHVAVLMELVRSGRVRGDPQVLLRPAPVDGSDRYDAVRRRYPGMLYAPPAWVRPGGGDWSGMMPLPDDVWFLANLTRHADVNVNVASTMTLDFAINDRPVVNIAFDVADPPCHAVPLRQYYYEFEHYRPVVELGAARIALSPDELAGHLNAYLADPSLDREARRRFVELQVGAAVGTSSGRIVDLLERIAACGR